MENVPVYVGLDYHQQSIQVCVVDAWGRVVRNRSVGNNLVEVTADGTAKRSAALNCLAWVPLAMP